MSQLCRLIPPVLLGLCVLTPVAASASHPAGVWGLVEKVTPLPDQQKPNQVRIEGLFMVANQQPDFAKYSGYGEPVYGIMFYECPADQLATCAMEWADLSAATLAEDDCRGWGDNSFKDNGKVRPFDAPQADPDVWPISMGVVTGFTPCDALREWKMNNPPPPMGDTTGGDTTGDGTGGGTDGTGGETDGVPGEETSEATGAPETGGGSQTGGDVTGAPDPTATGGEATGGTAGETGGGETGGGGGESGGAGESGDGQDSGDGGSKEAGCGCSAERPGGEALGALAFGFGLAALRRRRR